MATHPAVVEGIDQDHPDAGGLEAGLVCQLAGADGAEGVPLEQADGDPDCGGVDLEGMRRIWHAPEAEAGVPARVIVVVELGGVAVGDPLGQPPAVLLGAGRLRDELVPVMRVRREDPPVAHDERDPDGMEAVLEELESPPEVPLPAVGVAGEEEIERSGAGLGEHLRHRRRAPDGAAAVGDLEHEPGVDEAVALDEAILLLALARGAEAVVLARGGLADPTGHPQTSNVVERAG
jgi:hypothetical protein